MICECPKVLWGKYHRTEPIDSSVKREFATQSFQIWQQLSKVYKIGFIREIDSSVNQEFANFYNLTAAVIIQLTNVKWLAAQFKRHIFKWNSSAKWIDPNYLILKIKWIKCQFSFEGKFHNSSRFIHSFFFNYSQVFPHFLLCKLWWLQHYTNMYKIYKVSFSLNSPLL